MIFQELCPTKNKACQHLSPDRIYERTFEILGEYLKNKAIEPVKGSKIPEYVNIDKRRKEIIKIVMTDPIIKQEIVNSKQR